MCKLHKEKFMYFVFFMYLEWRTLVFFGALIKKLYFCSI